MRHLIVVALLCSPVTLLAQQPRNTISPGMTRAQVEAALGAPATMRSASDYSYLYYDNGCARECGMNDLVILHADSVVDAIFRSPDRHYTGQSSSPTEFAEVPAAPARKHAAAPPRTPAPVAAKPAVAAAKPAPAPGKPAVTTAAAVPAPTKPASDTVGKPAPTPAKPSVAPSTAKRIEVAGTKREGTPVKPKVIYVKGTNTEVVMPPANAQMKPPASGNDTKPSIPVKPETMSPAPATTPPAPAKKPTT
jgi:hypothetical protein